MSGEGNALALPRHTSPLTSGCARSVTESVTPARRRRPRPDPSPIVAGPGCGNGRCRASSCCTPVRSVGSSATGPRCCRRSDAARRIRPGCRVRRWSPGWPRPRPTGCGPCRLPVPVPVPERVRGVDVLVPMGYGVRPLGGVRVRRTHRMPQSVLPAGRMPAVPSGTRRPRPSRSPWQAPDTTSSLPPGAQSARGRHQPGRHADGEERRIWQQNLAPTRTPMIRTMRLRG